VSSSQCSALHRRLSGLRILCLLHRLRGLSLSGLLGVLLPLRAALRDRRIDGLGYVDMGVAFVRGIQITLDGERALGVLAQHNMIDPAHALGLCGDGHRGREIVAALIRRASMFCIQAMHRTQGLLVDLVAGMRGIGKRRRLNRLVQRFQRVSAGDAIGRQVMRTLKLLDSRSCAGTKVAICSDRAPVRVVKAKLGQLVLQIANSVATVVFT